MINPPYCLVEGIDGSGKDSQVDLLVGAFRDAGHNPLRVAEPDASLPTGALLRQLLKSGEYKEAHAALFLADRMALHVTKVLPALAEGRPVISSRSFLSTLAYQQENWPLNWLLAIHQQLPAKATHILVLDMDPAEALSRTQSRGGHAEVYERLDIQTRNRDRYRTLLTIPGLLDPFMAPPGRAVLVSAEGAPDDVHARIKAEVGL